MCVRVVSATPPSIAIEALVLGGPEVMRVVLVRLRTLRYTTGVAAEQTMASGKSNEDFRRRRLSLVDQDPANLAKAAAAMQVSPAGTSKPKARRLSVSPEMGQKSVVPVSFNPELCGTYSCHGIEPMGATGAKAKINQDRGCVVTPFAEPEDESFLQALFCVYDGHGASGDKASEFTMRKVADLVEQKLTAGIKEPEALRTAFLETDALLKADRTIDAELSGTTAVAMLLRQTGSKREAWLAWVGDSRAVWAQPQPSEKSGYKAQNLTEDQKPDTPAEMARIKQAGGFVSPPEEEWGGPARVWIDAEMTLPGLAMARSIGDHLVKTVGVIADPEVRAGATSMACESLEGRDVSRARRHDAPSCAPS